LLTTLGIAAGVATFLATALTIEAARRSYRDLFEGVNVPAGVTIAAPGGAGFDADLVAGMSDVEGVAQVSPRVSGVAALRRRSTTPILMQGADFTHGLVNELTLKDGHPPNAEGDVVLDAAFAEAERIDIGDRVHVLCAAGDVELTVVGRSTSRPFTSLPAAAVSLANAQRLFALPGRITQARLVTSRVDAGDRIAAEVARRLPAGLSVQSHDIGDGPGDAVRLAAERGLSAVSAVVLVVAVFVAFNAFLLNLTEAQAEFAVLRGLGATSGRIRQVILRQALLVGVIGAVAGVAAGYGLGVLSLGAISRLTGMPAVGPRFGAAAWFSLLLGPATALAAALVPAWRAGRQESLELNENDERLPRWTGTGGMALMGCGGGCLAAAALGYIPPSFENAAFVSALAASLAGAAIAYAALTPFALRLLVGRLSERFGVDVFLAVRHLARRPVRAALTSGTLFVVTVLAVGTGHVLLNTLDDLRQWCRSAIPADFLVRGSEPDAAFRLATALPEELGDQLAAQPGVAAVDRIAFVPSRGQGLDVLVLARTIRSDGPLPLDLRDGDPDDVRARLRRGEAAICSGLAREAGLAPGGTLTLETASGLQTVPIAAVVAEYAGGGRAIYLQWETARRLLAPQGVHAFLVTAEPGQTAAVAASLRNYCSRTGLLLQTGGDFRTQIDQMLARVATAFYAVLATAFVIAAFGLANVLWMNVKEQTREIGMFRALGMTQLRVGRVVLWQAASLAAISLPPGALAGAGLGCIVDAALRRLFGHTASFHLELGVSTGILLTALGVTLAAAFLPARQAARLDVVEALG
jgi:putative ABC transport system permease protein